MSVTIISAVIFSYPVRFVSLEEVKSVYVRVNVFLLFTASVATNDFASSSRT